MAEHYWTDNGQWVYEFVYSPREGETVKLYGTGNSLEDAKRNAVEKGKSHFHKPSRWTPPKFYQWWRWSEEIRG